MLQRKLMEILEKTLYWSLTHPYFCCLIEKIRSSLNAPLKVSLNYSKLFTAKCTFTLTGLKGTLKQAQEKSELIVPFFQISFKLFDKQGLQVKNSNMKSTVAGRVALNISTQQPHNDDQSHQRENI